MAKVVDVNKYNMRNLTKTQWTTFIITLVSMAFTLLADNGGVFGLGAKGFMILGFAKFAWDLYLSFNAQDVANFANNENVMSGAMAKGKPMINTKDIEEWRNN